MVIYVVPLEQPLGRFHDKLHPRLDAHKRLEGHGRPPRVGVVDGHLARVPLPGECLEGNLAVNLRLLRLQLQGGGGASAIQPFSHSAIQPWCSHRRVPPEGVKSCQNSETIVTLGCPERQNSDLLMDSPYGHMAALSAGAEGKYRSSVDAREPQNPTKSEEYQKWCRGGVEGVKRGCRGRVDTVRREHVRTMSSKRHRPPELLLMTKSTFERNTFSGSNTTSNTSGVRASTMVSERAVMCRHFLIIARSGIGARISCVNASSFTASDSPASRISSLSLSTSRAGVENSKTGALAELLPSTKPSMGKRQWSGSPACSPDLSSISSTSSAWCARISSGQKVKCTCGGGAEGVESEE
eukprot:526178-Prorocentrum_minimum.AAC.1